MALPTIPDFEAQANLRAADINEANGELVGVLGGVQGTTQSLAGLDPANFVSSGMGLRASHFLEHHGQSTVALPSWAFLLIPYEITIDSVSLMGTFVAAAAPNDYFKGSIDLVVDGVVVQSLSLVTAERNIGSDSLGMNYYIWWNNLSRRIRAGSIVGIDISGLTWSDGSAVDPYTVTLHSTLGYKRLLNIGTV